MMTHPATRHLARITTLFLLLGFACAATAQSRHAKINPWQKRFLIDPAKPYVYLEVDHVGPREPRGPASRTGIWLRLHNNCIVPITVYTFGVPDRAFTLPSASHDDEIGVYDAVIANPPLVEFVIDDSPLPRTLKSSELAKFLWAQPQPQPTPTGLAQPSRPKPQDSPMPAGYWADIGSLTTIYPGHSIYFSLPRNHVSPKWHVQIPFNFDLDVRSNIPHPENYVTLYEDQVEKRIQTQKNTTE